MNDSDASIVISVMKSSPEILEWLGSKSREQQLAIMNGVKVLMLVCKGHNLGPKGALEIMYQLERHLTSSPKAKRNGNMRVYTQYLTGGNHAEDTVDGR